MLLFQCRSKFGCIEIYICCQMNDIHPHVHCLTPLEERHHQWQKILRGQTLVTHSEWRWPFQSPRWWRRWSRRWELWRGGWRWWWRGEGGGSEHPSSASETIKNIDKITNFTLQLGLAFTIVLFTWLPVVAGLVWKTLGALYLSARRGLVGYIRGINMMWVDQPPSQ